MRPRLHRYCARMVGSVIDGEDVLQDALIKAVESFAVRRPDSQSRGLAVSDRAQHRAGFPAPPQPAGSAPIGRGGGHDRRSARCRLEPPDREREPAHLHAASGGAALQRDPDGRARLLLAGGLRGHGFEPAGGEGGATSRPHATARTRRTSRTMRRRRNCRMPIARGFPPMSRISTRGISTRSAP